MSNSKLIFIMIYTLLNKLPKVCTAWIVYKFKRPRKDDAVLSLSREQFDWLLRGLDIAKLTSHTEKYFSSVT